MTQRVLRSSSSEGEAVYIFHDDLNDALLFPHCLHFTLASTERGFSGPSAYYLHQPWLIRMYPSKQNMRTLR
jgi:hypothetical protein